MKEPIVGHDPAHSGWGGSLQLQHPQIKGTTSDVLNRVARIPPTVTICQQCAQNGTILPCLFACSLPHSPHLLHNITSHHKANQSPSPKYPFLFLEMQPTHHRMLLRHTSCRILLRSHPADSEIDQYSPD